MTANPTYTPEFEKAARAFAQREEGDESLWESFGPALIVFLEAMRSGLPDSEWTKRFDPKNGMRLVAEGYVDSHIRHITRAGATDGR